MPGLIIFVFEKSGFYIVKKYLFALIFFFKDSGDDLFFKQKENIISLNLSVTTYIGFI